MPKALCFIIIGLSCFHNVLSAGNGSKVASDQQVEEGEFPFVVSLQSLARRHFCAGSLVTLSYILSTCKCIEIVYDSGVHESNQTFKSIAVAGGIDITSAGNNQIREIRHYKKHDECGKEFEMENDFGLCKTTDPFEAGPKLNVIKVFSWNKNELEENTNELTYQNAICQVLGWGAHNDSLDSKYSDSDVLMKVNMYLGHYPMCKNDACALGSKHHCSLPELPHNYNGQQLCAFGCNTGDACKGDFGGPIYCNGYVYGFLSWRYRCSENTSISMYSRIDNGLDFFDWVLSGTVAYNKCSIIRSHMSILSLLAGFLVFHTKNKK